MPAKNPGRNLTRTLAAISRQTYPLELLELVIADDGSQEPVRLQATSPVASKVVRLEPTGEFGAGRARNAAAGAASGDILMFLDADVVPERQVVEAYARWFARSADVVPMGLCKFVDMADLSDAQLHHAIETSTLAAVFHGREIDQQDWRENTFHRTDDLRSEAHDAFRIVIGATFAVSAAQFVEVGGFRELGMRGIEDTELGYRLHNNGAVLVLDRQALHWHQGRRNLTARRREIKGIRAPYMTRLIPVHGFRREVPEPLDIPIKTVPRMRIYIDPAGLSPVQAAAAAELVRTHAPADVNVVLAGETHAGDDSEPVLSHMWLPANLRISAATISALLDVVRNRTVGVVRIFNPTGGIHGELRTARAHRRALRLGQGRPVSVVAAELFGQWWVDAAQIHAEWVLPDGSTAGVAPASPLKAEDDGASATPREQERRDPTSAARRALQRFCR